MIVNRCGINFLVIDDRHRGFWNQESWEQDTYDAVQKFSNPEKVFIDVGSWIGPISLVAAKLNKICYAIEPDPVAYKELQANINLNNITNIKSYNVAMSDVDGVIQLGSSKLGDSCTRSTLYSNTFDVKSITMTSFLYEHNINESDISLLKIDVEGAEAEILKDDFFKTSEIPVHLSVHIPFFKNSNDASVIQDFVSRYKYKIGHIDFNYPSSILLYN